MSNDACGTMKVVAKNKNTLKRLLKIMNYEDTEYCLYRCKSCDAESEPYKEDGFWVQMFGIDGAWSCEPFLNYGDHPDRHLKEYQKKKDGTFDYSKEEVETSTHFTDLSHLAKTLKFGAMFWTSESGCCFAERGLVHANGRYEYDTEHYELHYAEDENGEIDYSQEPEEDCGFGDEFNEWLYNDEIYEDEVYEEEED